MGGEALALLDALRDKRTDTALVRLVAWPAHGRDEEATAMVASFAENLYPLLRKCLPGQPY